MPWHKSHKHHTWKPPIPKWKRYAFVGSLVCLLIGSTGYLFMRRHREQMRADALPITRNNAMPIIDAIGHYIKDNGIPPVKLSQLHPRYISDFPDAGPIAEDGWQYERYEDTRAGAWSLWIKIRQEYNPNFFSLGDIYQYIASENSIKSSKKKNVIPQGEWKYIGD